MCNLYSNTLPHDVMRSLFDVEPADSQLGNMAALPAIFPKHEAPIIAINRDGRRALIRAKWGFLTQPKRSKRTGDWLSPPAWNNARDDKLTVSNLWRRSFENRRCLIPASAYAESTGSKPATYHWLAAPDVDGFAIAGLWTKQTGTFGAIDVDQISFTMVTTTPNAVAVEYHHRMPLVLQPEDHELWLRGDPGEARPLVRQPSDNAVEVVASGERMLQLSR
ncbi:SOS response-associated peptidase [Aestuariibius sp. 2305UL40-4]|uniref:SOS response-associated peptidase n=1 Tax=Aestuariibius violaceus TaxID=3234132 RepID=UPI00345E08C3